MVSNSRSKSCFMSVRRSEDHWQLGVVEPSSSPVDIRLHSREPWVAQDHALWAQVRQEESHILFLLPRLDFQIRVELDIPLLVL